MKTYTISITDCTDGYRSTGEIHVRAANKTEARKLGRLYIRQWQLRSATISSVEEVTHA